MVGTCSDTMEALSEHSRTLALTGTSADCKSPPWKNALPLEHGSGTVRTNAEREGFGRERLLGKFQLGRTETSARTPAEPRAMEAGIISIPLSSQKTEISHQFSLWKCFGIGRGANKQRRGADGMGWGDLPCCQGQCQQRQANCWRLLAHSCLAGAALSKWDASCSTAGAFLCCPCKMGASIGIRWGL